MGCATKSQVAGAYLRPGTEAEFDWATNRQLHPDRIANRILNRATDESRIDGQDSGKDDCECQG